MLASARYYDEDAETLGFFLQFAEDSNSTITNTALANAAIAWSETQNLWNGSLYIYKTSEPVVECESGNFAMVIAQYEQIMNGSTPFFNRVILDLENKLLINGFYSPLWGFSNQSAWINGVWTNQTYLNPGVIQHAAIVNPQLRLGDTLGTITALQMLYPYFNTSMQNSFRQELQTAWQGLTNSLLYSNGAFLWMALPPNEPLGSVNSDADLAGAMALFIDGITPGTGYLDIKASNERYDDYQSCFPTSEWQFNYTDHSIEIPASAGTLTFSFGSEPVTYNFLAAGVYKIQFSNDWNRAVSAIRDSGS